MCVGLEKTDMEKGWTRKEERVDRGPCPEGLEIDTAAVMTADVYCVSAGRTSLP